jgi:hypothetical protein
MTCRNPFKRWCFLAAGLAAVALGTPSASAGVVFQIGPNNSPEVLSGGTPTGNAWNIGAGWDTAQAGGTDNDSSRLGATFDVDGSVPTINALLTPGAWVMFNFGSITLTEPNAGGGIAAGETDGLALTAHLSFTSPAGVGVVDIPGSVTATTGAVSDAAIDLTVTFPAVLVNFGNGGKFSVDLSDIVFSTQETLAVNAAVTLLDEPTEGGGGGGGGGGGETPVHTPEPTSLAIWGLGAFAAAFVAVRRRRTQGARR